MISTTRLSGWIRRGRVDRCAFLALAVLASTMTRGQDVGQPEAGTETEKKKAEERVRYFQKAFEAQTRVGADQSTRWKQLNPERYYYSYSRSTDDFRIGASLHAVDDALRSHLVIPKGQGVVVVQVARNSAAARAGIKKHDVLLTVTDAGKFLSISRSKLYEMMDSGELCYVTASTPTPATARMAGR